MTERLKNRSAVGDKIAVERGALEALQYESLTADQMPEGDDERVGRRLRKPDVNPKRRQRGRGQQQASDNRLLSLLKVRTTTKRRQDNMTTIETNEPCDAGCGYASSGQDLLDHMLWEHRDCTECGRKPSGPPDNLSVTHKPDCPRLQPGYVYPPLEG